jgi:hypothetical protein
MPPVHRVILVSSVLAFAALCCSHLHGGDKTANSHTCGSCEKAIPPLLDSGGKQHCAAKSIWCPSHYYPKSPPCICPPTYCGRCDCYNAKCLPRVKIPCCFPSYYKCPPPKCCGIPAAKADMGPIAIQPRGDRPQRWVGSPGPARFLTPPTATARTLP